MMRGVAAPTPTGGLYEQSKHDQGSHCGGRAGNGRRGGRHRRRGRGSEWIGQLGDGYLIDPVDAEHDGHSAHDKHDPVENDPGAERDATVGSPLPEHGQRVERGFELEIRLGQRIGIELQRPSPGACRYRRVAGRNGDSPRRGVSPGFGSSSSPASVCEVAE
jgi:hypothetical protein